VRIAQITDIHIGFDRGNPDEHNMQRLRAVLQRLIESPNRPDLLLLSGDLTEFGDAESYTRLAEAVSICPFPVWPMTGNHDERGPLLEVFRQTPSEGGFLHYVLEFPGLRLIVLDTLEPGRHGGSFCEARAEWLKAQLVADTQTPTVIAMHHPPFESGLTWLDSSGREPWIARFADTIAGQEHVKAIIAGHLHRTIHTSWNGVSLTVCMSVAPAVALDLTPIDPDVPDNRPLITDELAGYALHRWDGERLISHFESVGALRVLARYDESLQEVVRIIQDERPD
jgi:3',5'-cyclic-AMP phosphodiesterase